MGKHIIIYDAGKSGDAWKKDLKHRCNEYKKADRKNLHVLVVAQRDEGSLNVTGSLARMLDEHALSLMSISTDCDKAVTIGAYLHNGFMVGLFPAGSDIQIVTTSKSVVSTVTLATILAAAYIKPEDKFSVKVHEVHVHAISDTVSHYRTKVIMGADPEDS